MFIKPLNILIAILLFAVLFVSIDDSNTVWAGKEDVKSITIEDIAGGPNTSGIFGDFIFSFELLSLLLIAALIGALYLAKREA